MHKFRFWMTSTNAAGNTRGTSLGKNQPVHVRGWDVGVKVVPMPSRTLSSDDDVFQLWMTSGSHGGGSDVLLGAVRLGQDGPQFVVSPGLVAVDEVL